MSQQAQHDSKNEAEITYWNSAGGRLWVERQQSQDIVSKSPFLPPVPAASSTAKTK
jgi:hypothetical protein